jgi:hypothetical protein
MTDLFHRECTIAILKDEPSSESRNGGRSLMVSLIVPRGDNRKRSTKIKLNSLILGCPARSSGLISASPLYSPPLMTRSRLEAKSSIEPPTEAGTDLTCMSYVHFSLSFALEMSYNRCLHLNPFLLKGQIPHESGKRSQEGYHWHHPHR